MDRAEIEKISTEVADSVIARYNPPQSVEHGLVESMGEEHAAAEIYLKRAQHALENGNIGVSELYEHLASEELGHVDELLQMQSGIGEPGFVEPMNEDIDWMGARVRVKHNTNEAMTGGRQGTITEVRGSDFLVLLDNDPTNQPILLSADNLVFEIPTECKGPVIFTDTKGQAVHLKHFPYREDYNNDEEYIEHLNAWNSHFRGPVARLGSQDSDLRIQEFLKNAGGWGIKQDRQGNLLFGHTAGIETFLQDESDKELIYGILTEAEKADIEKGWNIIILDSEPRASILQEIEDANSLTGNRPPVAYGKVQSKKYTDCIQYKLVGIHPQDEEEMHAAFAAAAGDCADILLKKAKKKAIES